MGNVETMRTWRENLTARSEALLASEAMQSTHPRSASELPSLADLQSTPWAHSTRRVKREDVTRLITDRRPEAGDLVVARVDALGHHANLQLVCGRRRRLFPGDTIVVAYGNRYACEQFEAEVPAALSPCHLVAGGGIASRALSWHDRISRGPTQITPLALLGDAKGRVLNLARYAVAARPAAGRRPRVLAVLGTAMDAGKTQTAAFLTRGLRNRGLRAGYLKITGTGAGGDTWLLDDAGADRVLDFTDAGMASTYRADLPRIEAAMETLLGDMADHAIDLVVMEVADGVFQQETAALLRGERFAQCVDGIILAGRDAMGVATGHAVLAALPVPVIAVSGLLCASPLQRREAEQATGLESFNREELARADVADALLRRARVHGDNAPDLIREAI